MNISNKSNSDYLSIDPSRRPEPLPSPKLTWSTPDKNWSHTDNNNRTNTPLPPNLDFNKWNPVTREQSSVFSTIQSYRTMISDFLKALTPKGDWEGPKTTAPTTKPNNVTDQKNELPRMNFQDKMNLLMEPHRASGKVSEAELQTALIANQLHHVGDSVELLFLSTFDTSRRSGFSISEANKLALRVVAQTGSIEKKDADWVYSLTYRAAQLDKDLNSMKESHSNKGVANIQDALSISEVNLVQINQGIIIPSNRSVF